MIYDTDSIELIIESLEERLSDERSKVNTDPTEGQKKAGNYQMGHLTIHGLKISIENPKGSYRKGKDKDGKEWKTLMHNDYGYFNRTLGKDGDAVDVFIGPNLDSDKVYPIDQFIDGKFDETKVMLGFDSKEEAKQAYLSNYDKNWKGFKYITEVDFNKFKNWLYDGHRQRIPFAKYSWLNEAKKYNPPKDIVSAINKANRDEDIKSHGKPTSFRTTIEKNPKAYNRRKEKKVDMEEINEGRKIYLSERQFKSFCRNLLNERRKEEYIEGIVKKIFG